jgi:ABC-type transporter Mla subunit MlaD
LRIIDVLKIDWTIAGIDAPAVTWCAAIAIVLGSAGFLVRLFWIVSREKKLLRKTTNELGKVLPVEPKGKGHPTKNKRNGLPGAAYDSLRQVFEKVPRLELAWRGYDSQLLLRPDALGADHFWSSESANLAFSSQAVIDPYINRSLYSAVPSIVTGLGLMFTFIAILIALLDVRLVNSRVQGVELLIQGLSGKFLSSIAALLSATIFVVIEKRLFYGLDKNRLRLVATLDGMIPRLSPTRILVDLEQNIAEQTNAFRDFNTGLAPMLQRSFSESMGPTLERMVKVIDELNQMMRAAEAQKQESITGSLDALLRNLEQSLKSSIDQMAQAFTQSLSGNAMNQFDKVEKSLQDTAMLLESMNTQFSEMLNQAKVSTAEQLNIGRSQVEELSSVLRSLMDQLKQTTDSSVGNMSATLTAVVHSLSSDVRTLSEQMSTTMQESSQRATGAASAMIERADSWSTRNAEQLAALLDKHQGQLDGIDKLRIVLDSSLGSFNQSLRQHSEIVSSLQSIAREVNGTVSSIRSASEEIKKVQGSLQTVATMSNEQVGNLADANAKQAATWVKIDESMEHYKQAFTSVESSAGSLLTQITEHLSNHVQVTQNGYEELVKQSSEHFKNATERLGASVGELDEFLQELSGALERGQLVTQ